MKKHKQSGSTLVIALVLLTIITVVAVYSLEGSNIQSKMVANSLFSTLTYQECRNEQEANIRLYKFDRTPLIDLISTGQSIVSSDTLTENYSNYGPKSDLNTSWTYQRPVKNAIGGETTNGDVQHELFELTCNAAFNYSKNQQTLGVIVKVLSNNSRVQ